ncbi:MAG: Hint domain-containing protein [Acetobacteraceae bacterium]|nr:Hint domain-containing protein [Acetobacteraceae bacterium]
MAGRTISTGYTSGITLAEGDNPLTITTTGSVASSDAPALLTAGTVDWVIGNAGTIAASGTSKASVGIMMTGTAGSAGGTITNAATGAISGGQFGIYGLNQTTVTNAGSITGTGAATGVGVLLGTGDVANTGGTILGAKYGVYLIGTGTVSNTGSIGGASNAGVVLNAGGSLANTGAAAAITGARVGVYLYGGGTVTNTGSIGGTGTAGYGALMKAGGSFDNQAGGQVSGVSIAVASSGTQPATMTNAGTLAGGTYGIGIVKAAASVTNTATGVITGGAAGMLVLTGGTAENAGSVTGRFGIQALNSVATVTNSGTIHSTGKFVGQASEAVGAGIQVSAGGTIVNAAGGSIGGYWIGAQIGNFSGGNANGGAVLNAGTITANDPGVSGAAVWFKGSGTISNAATGTIAGGPFGVVSYDNITIVNRGLISGEQHAVFTSAAGNADRIIVYPGASFSGTVLGDKAGVATPTGVLELGAGAAAGAISGFGSKYLGFARVEVDAGATWTLDGTVGSGQTVALGAAAQLTLANPGAMAGVLTGFDPSDSLVLGGITDVIATSLDAGNVLTVSRAGGGSIALRFDPAQSFPAGSFGFTAGPGGTALSAPCFAQGTRIATEAGAVPVEALAPGMRVLRAGGGMAAVVWVGHRRVDCTRHPRPQEVWPVRIQAGAFARGVPARDLWLSPDHAVLAGGVLIPVRHLVNGRSIRQEAADAVTYFHVELAAHDVVLAEGLACESYLDTGNRSAFANGGGATMLHPDFARRHWAAASCAPLVEAGPARAAARTRLLARAGALGHRRSLDPALGVLADGAALAIHARGRRREVALPGGLAALAIVSRGWVAAHVEPDGDDTRRLGVAIARITLDGAALALDDARLGAGWHRVEHGWRWTDGHAWLHPRGATRLGFDIAATGQYWIDRHGTGQDRAMPAGAAGA